MILRVALPVRVRQVSTGRVTSPEADDFEVSLAGSWWYRKLGANGGAERGKGGEPCKIVGNVGVRTQ